MEQLGHDNLAMCICIEVETFFLLALHIQCSSYDDVTIMTDMHSFKVTAKRWKTQN